MGSHNRHGWIAAGLPTLFLGIALGAAPATPPAPQNMPATSPPAATTQPAERQRFVDPSYGFSLAVPKLGGTGKERAVAVMFAGPPENAFAPNINILIDPGQTTLDEYVAPALAGLKDAKIISQQKREVSGRPAELLSYERTANGRTVHILQLVVIGDGLTYVATCTCSAESYKDHEPEFQTCLDSFRLPVR